MHSHDFISVSVGEIRPNGEGNLSLILPRQRPGNITGLLRRGAYRYYYSRRWPPTIFLCGMPDRGNRYEVCVRAGGRFHRRLTLFALAAQSRRSALHFAAAQPFPPAAGRATAVCRRYRRTPLLAMDADCRQKGGAGAALLCRQFAPDRLLPAPGPADCERHGGDSLQREGESFRQQIFIA